jgi:hypothetical protein
MGLGAGARTYDIVRIRAKYVRYTNVCVCVCVCVCVHVCA